MHLNSIELFCGAGLIGEGFSRAGFHAIHAIDLDRDAVDSYNKNLKHSVATVGDVSKVKKGIKCDLIIAGPPCQGFSTLGKRDKDDVRNKLSLLLVDWAISTETKAIVIENVPQFTRSNYYQELISSFKDIGYQHVMWEMNASDFGAAQHRHRSFTIFSKIGLPKQPTTKKKKVSVRQAFKGLRKKPNASGMHSLPPPTELSLERIKRIPKNGNKFDLMGTNPELCPKSWFKLGRQAVDVWGRMDYDAPANTLRCCFLNPSKGRYIHPTENRVITPREGARLQGVPDHWEFSGSRYSSARQIGNGVPIPLAETVANAVRQIF